MPFNVSVLRAAKRCRLIRLEMLKGPEATAESMTAAILGSIYLEG